MSSRRNKRKTKEDKKPNKTKNPSEAKVVLYAVGEVFFEGARFQDLVRKAVIGCPGRWSATNESAVSRDLVDT